MVDFSDKRQQQTEEMTIGGFHIRVDYPKSEAGRVYVVTPPAGPPCVIRQWRSIVCPPVLVADSLVLAGGSEVLSISKTGNSTWARSLEYDYSPSRLVAFDQYVILTDGSIKVHGPENAADYADWTSRVGEWHFTIVVDARSGETHERASVFELGEPLFSSKNGVFFLRTVLPETYEDFRSGVSETVIELRSIPDLRVQSRWVIDSPEAWSDLMTGAASMPGVTVFSRAFVWRGIEAANKSSTICEFYERDSSFGEGMSINPVEGGVRGYVELNQQTGALEIFVVVSDSDSRKVVVEAEQHGGGGWAE